VVKVPSKQRDAQGGTPVTLAEFRCTLSQHAPAAGLPPALAALWWAAKGDWNKAHEIVMDEGGRDAAWVHAYLHRVEGDLGNARYWYRQAGRSPATGALDAEWEAIVRALI
jgi:hypothetical protein